MTLQEINFWKRLENFISNVHVNDMPSEEEKEMILNICKREQASKNLVQPDVINSICPTCGGQGWEYSKRQTMEQCQSCKGTGQTVL